MNTARSSLFVLLASLAGCAAYYPQPASLAYGYGYTGTAPAAVYPGYVSPAVVYGGYRGPAIVREPHHQYREHGWQPRRGDDHDRGHGRHEHRG